MTFRILSLDGGGTWSLIQVRTLQALFKGDPSGHEILNKFSLVAANSGGSIVLGGLLANMRLSEIAQLYCTESDRKRIFHQLDPVLHLIDYAAHELLKVLPQFSTEKKLQALRGILGPVGDTNLQDLTHNVPGCPHILISAFDYDAHRAAFFRSDVNSCVNTGCINPEPTVAEAIHASSTAPVNFFDHPAHFRSNGFKNRRFWDGAVGGYNNPVLAAVIEAVSNGEEYGCQLEDIRVLSIGTANNALPLPDKHQSASPVLVAQEQTSNPLNDIRLLATAIVDDPPDAASFSAHVMLGGKVSGDDKYPVTDGPVVRLNPILQPILDGSVWKLPTQNDGASLNFAEFGKLVEMDMAATTNDEVTLIDSLYRAWADDNILNQPIHTSVSLKPLVGHRYFSQGIARWEQFERENAESRPAVGTEAEAK